MPSLKTIGEQAAASATKLHGNFEAVWSVLDPSKVTHDGQGQYSYTGAGRTSENIGTIRTIRPLDPKHKSGMSTFEVTIVDPGKREYAVFGPVSGVYLHSSLVPRPKPPCREEGLVTFECFLGYAYHYVITFQMVLHNPYGVHAQVYEYLQSDWLA